MNGLRHRGYAGNRGTDNAGVDFISLYTASACAKGEVRVVDFSSTLGEIAAAPATNAGNVDSVVAAEAIAAGAIGLFYIGGEIEEAKVANGVAVGDHLEVIAAGTNYIVDGSTGSTARGTLTAAIAMEANASGEVALAKIYKYKVPHTVAAS